VLGGGLGAIVEEIRAGLLDGVNVTMPLKGEAYEAADVLTTEAERSASVNTLRLRDGVIEAHSTDTVAFGEIFDRVTGPAQLLILGAGGSARAALAAWTGGEVRSEEHTSELQSREKLVCRLLLEKKNSRDDTLSQFNCL